MLEKPETNFSTCNPADQSAILILNKRRERMLCEFSLLTSDAYVNDEWYSHIFNFHLNLAAEWMDKLNEEEKELANRTFDAALEFLSLVDGDCDRGRAHV